MTPSEPRPVPKVFAAVHAVLSQFGHLSKSNTNTFQQYKFRSIADTMAKLQPLLIKNNLIMEPCYSNHKLHDQEKGFTATVDLALTFRAIEDGSSITMFAVGQGADAGDKASNKAMAAAMKYAILHGFAVPEDGVDSEFSEPEVKPKKPTTTSNKLKEILG